MYKCQSHSKTPRLRADKERNQSIITPYASLKSLLSFKTAVFGIPINDHLEWEKESDKKQKKNRDAVNVPII